MRDGSSSMPMSSMVYELCARSFLPFVCVKWQGGPGQRKCMASSLASSLFFSVTTNRIRRVYSNIALLPSSGEN